MDQGHEIRKAEEIVRQRQAQTREKILERFARHGHPVCQTILDAVMSKRGLVFLMQQLGIQPPRIQEQQYEALSTYLHENGAAKFLKRVDSKSYGTRTYVPAEDAIESADAPMADAPTFDAAGNYIGPERRRNLERRSNRDRREDVQGITKNKRYGGDRRNLLRRAEDRAQALSGKWPAGYSQRVRDRMTLKK